MKQLPDEIKLTYIILIVVMLLFVVFIILIVFLYNRKQILYLKEKQLQKAEHQTQLLQIELERQKSVEAERERISLDMHDDLGAGISALKLQTEFLKEKVKGDESLQKDVDELLKTAVDMNLSMREMLWNLNKTNDNLESLVNYILIYAENFFNKTKIKLMFDNHLNSINFPISSDVRWHLFLCVKESLNNIYKHSDANTVLIKFYQTENQLILEIKDDGIGIIKYQNEGNGFVNMTHRMQESCGYFEILPSEKGLHLGFFLPL